MKSIRFAEWVSLAISSTLILLVIGYLIVGMTRNTDDYVLITARVDQAKLKEKDGKTIVPILVRNESRKPAKNIVLKVGNSEVALDYLPAESEDRVFVFVDANEATSLKVVPLSYQSEVD